MFTNFVVQSSLEPFSEMKLNLFRCLQTQNTCIGVKQPSWELVIFISENYVFFLKQCLPLQ